MNGRALERNRQQSRQANTGVQNKYTQQIHNGSTSDCIQHDSAGCPDGDDRGVSGEVRGGRRTCGVHDWEEGWEREANSRPDQYADSHS